MSFSDFGHSTQGTATSFNLVYLTTLESLKVTDSQSLKNCNQSSQIFLNLANQH